MKIIKYYTLLILTIFNFSQSFGFSPSEVTPNTKSIINSWWSDWFEILQDIFKGISFYIFSFMALILIGVFIYIGYLFITSDWDEAQFKKAWKSFVYTIIGIIIIVLSWWTVKLIITVWL